MSWTVWQEREHTIHVVEPVSASEGEKVCTLKGSQNLPRARLISAAPEMLEELKNAVRAVDEWTTLRRETVPWLAAAEAVIAKAEGRTQ